MENLYFFQTLFFVTCSIRNFNISIQKNEDNSTRNCKKKINVIVSLLVLLFYQFSHFPLPKGGGGMRKEKF